MKPPSADGAADIRHEALVEPNIMHGNQYRSKHLGREKKVANGAAREMRASVAIAAGFDGVFIGGGFSVGQSKRAGGGEGGGGAAVAGGGGAAEQIDPRRGGGGGGRGEAEAHRETGVVAAEEGGG